MNMKVSELGLALIHVASKCVRDCWRQRCYCYSSSLDDGVEGFAGVADDSKSHCYSRTKGRRLKHDNYGCPVVFGSRS